MPATLAHYIFGQKCLTALPEDLANQISKNIDYYDFMVLISSSITSHYEAMISTNMPLSFIISHLMCFSVNLPKLISQVKEKMKPWPMPWAF